ncbi:hypothetical protein BKA62DRAFT_587178, partial [Auriculariales sp. MPI-PUGE-AT-0066]
EIAVDLDLPLRSVQFIRHRWKILKEVIREPRREGPPRVLSDYHCEFIRGIVAHTPDMFLEEIKCELWDRHRISVSLSTLYRSMKELDLPLKGLSKRAAEASAEKRIKYINEVRNEPPERLVFGDESAVNALTGMRTHGRAP